MLEFPIDLLGQSQYLYHLFAVILELLSWTRNHPLNIYKVPYISKEPLETYNLLFASSKDDNPSVIAPTKYTYLT